MAPRARMKHEIKCVQPHFEEVWHRRKPFEVRRDDRDYQPGDVVVIREWDSLGYGYRSCVFVIGYVLRGYAAIRKGYCVFGLLGPDAEALSMADAA